MDSVELIVLHCSKFPENRPDISTRFQGKHGGWVANPFAMYSSAPTENARGVF